VQKRAKMCKNVHLKYLFIKKRASQGLIYQKTCKNVQKTCKNVQKRASQMFLDPIQKRVLSRSVHLEAVHLEALLYVNLIRACMNFDHQLIYISDFFIHFMNF
jgi:ABC-type uncharacterized transport system involved in gliding motility auxiliary subunit